MSDEGQLKPGALEPDRDWAFNHVADAVLRMGGTLDDLAAVVTVTAMVESLIRELISLKADINILEPQNQRLPFMSMVRLARALGVLPEALQQPLAKLAEVRNRFAHRISHVLSEDDVKKVRDTLSESQRDSVDTLEAQMTSRKKFTKGPALHIRCFSIWLLDEVHLAFISKSHKTAK